MLGGGIDVFLRPVVRLRELHDTILYQQIEHRRLAFVTPLAKVHGRDRRGHRKHLIPFLIGGLEERLVRARHWLEPQVHELIKRQSDSHRPSSF